MNIDKDINEALEEVKLHKEGKLELQTYEEFEKEMNIDKDIERCKELIKTEHSNWIGLTNQEAISNVLSEFQGLREFSTETVRRNAELQEELETYKKIAEKLAYEILLKTPFVDMSEENIKILIDEARKEVEANETHS